MIQRASRVAAAGGQWEVTFEAAPEDLNDVINAAYRQKYAANPYQSHMIGSTARAATVRISPRSD
jgi:hypothetical protein